METVVELGRAFIGYLAQTDMEDYKAHMRDPGGLSSYETCGIPDLKWYLCHVASRSAVKLAQARAIGEIFEEEISPFEITRIGRLWSAPATETLFARRVPGVFAAQVIRDTLVSQAKVYSGESVSKKWIAVYLELGNRIAALGSNPPAGAQVAAGYADLLQDYWDAHARPYLNDLPKDENGQPDRKTIATILQNPGVPRDLLHFAETHKLESAFEMHRMLKDMLVLMEDEAKGRGTRTNCIPAGFMLQYVADTSRVYCALATRDGAPTIDQVRFLHLLCGADLTLGQIETIGSDDLFLKSLPTTLRALGQLWQDSSTAPETLFSLPIAMAFVQAIAKIGEDLLALGPENASKGHALLAHYSQLIRDELMSAFSAQSSQNTDD